ncbi:MAG TPA: peptidoglycan DD-metalloendopeptidase family protein [Candidatus Mediterraneibacter cottocaccae]|nr:peptidoglycan DD-metalloendopeptidase family protein [Candidatus Mediterraneibacter cottocaccae]
MRKRMRRTVCAAMVFILCAGPVMRVSADEVQEAQEKVEDAENEAQALEQQRQEAEADHESLSARLDGIIADMNETQEKLTAKEAEIEAAEEELIQARVDENEQYESMKIRIKFMYESGGIGMLEVLMQSQSIGEFLNNAEYVTQLSEYDRNELIRYQETVKQVEEKEAALQTEYEELNVLQTSLVSQQEEVQTLLESNEAQLAEIQSQIDANAEKLEELRQEAEDAKRRQEEKEAQAAQAAQNGGYSGSYTGNVVSGNGYFTHPCPGMTRQSSYFGEVRSFSSTPHAGNDYAAPVGTPTYAAASGTVITATYSNTAGNYVVISHGNGLVTKYMHHVNICVSAGQHVEKGQQIGWVGSTGRSTGPHLHFQVEENGTPVNPDKYL